MTGKILGIGLQRTGTTSLYQALTALGYRAAPDAIALYYDLQSPKLKQYDAFMDNPIPLIYPQIDQAIPDCRFILTTRSEESWLASAQWLFEQELPTLSSKLRKVADEIHTAFYGTRYYDEDIFRAKWRSYHEEVHAYFANRSQDLLTLNFEQGEGWEQLCGFLGKDVPPLDFPHKNRTR